MIQQVRAAGTIKPNFYCDTQGRYTIVDPAHFGVDRFLQMDEYTAAKAFVEGKLIVRGDLCEAIPFFHRHECPLVRQLWFSLLARLPQSAGHLFNSKNTTARNIGFHYDRSNRFYSKFLDSRMLYSAAQFNGAARSLEEAQTTKLEDICRVLQLHSSDRFLDIGCGWGALVMHAAERFGVTAVGCTLSRNQAEFARSAVRARGLESRVAIVETDYRDLQGSFDKVASVGMFEHVGRKNLRRYFRKVHSLLAEDGLFLNRGIVRPETVSAGPATLFLQRHVFPGGGLVHLADAVREAGKAGFLVLEVKDFREDYAHTCRAWVDRLLDNSAECSFLVGDECYRTWLLYLAASAVSFEDGVTDAAQIAFQKQRDSLSDFSVSSIGPLCTRAGDGRNGY